MTPLIAMPAAPGSMPGSAAGAAALPELPALSTLLHGARRAPGAGDWRAEVLHALGIAAEPAPDAASVAACALPEVAAGAGICLAQPVHLVAGMSRMYLGAAQAFALDAARREQLRLDFNAEFGGADVQLHAVGAGWVLQAPFAAAADDPAPESLQAGALTRTPASSQAGRLLRRLGAEVEMWLAALPFNSAREARGEPPINCIWFWSGSTRSDVPAPASRPGGVFCTGEADAWLSGLAVRCGVSMQQAGHWQQVRDTPGALVFLTTQGDPLAAMAGWEANWFGPVAHDLASRRLSGLRLQVGGSTWELPAPRLSRWFRRRRPWWQKVAQ